MATRPIIVGTDFSEASQRAVARAAALSRRLALPLHLIHVIDETALRPTRTPLPLQWRTSFTGGPQSRGDAWKKLDLVGRKLDEVRAGSGAVKTLRRYGRPHASIARAAERSKARLVVVGTRAHGVSVGRFLLGSTADRVLRTSERPVLIVRKKGVRPYRTALVPVDLTKLTRHQLEVLRDLLPDLSLTIVHVKVSTLEDGSSRQSGPESTARRFATDAGFAPGAITFRLARGDPRDAILQYERQLLPDLIVVGTHGRTGLPRALIGSVAEQVIRAAKTDVLAIPPPAR